MTFRANISTRRLIAMSLVLFAVVMIGVWRRHASQRLYLRQSDDLSANSGHTVWVPPKVKGKTLVDRQIAKVNPRDDGWTSEVVSSAIDRQLTRIQSAVERGFSDGLPTGVTDLEFRGEKAVIERMQRIVADNLIQVDRLPRSDDCRTATSSLVESIESWTGGELASVTRCSFKTVAIQIIDETSQAQTRVLVELYGRDNQRNWQTNLVCHCRWRWADDGSSETPVLAELRIEQLERVRLAARGAALFEDVTHSALRQTPGYEEQVRRAVGHWSERLTGLYDMRIYGHHGIAVGDVNGDGRDDLYVCDGGGLPNRLYLQQADGSVEDRSAASNADWLESSAGALLVDLDNDGDQDLVVATIAAIVVAANDGDGHFQIRAAFTEHPEAHTLCAADYDNDGDLDIYVCNYGPGRSTHGKRGFEGTLPIPYNDARNGGRNALLENRGQWRFVDVTGDCGLEQNNRRWSFAAAWEDYDFDGDMDLYVANDFGRNNLYRNDEGKFRDVANALNVEDMAAGMSVSWADANQDGNLDLYVGNMYSAAGNRVTYQRRFLSGRDQQSSQAVQRMARGNTLFVGQADGSFTDESRSAGVMMGRWSWASKFVDLNNDGWQDILVSNGYLTNRKTDDL